MGRPLHKKYFGNRNIGVGGNQSGVLANSQNYADDRIGGEGVASYGSIVAGSGWTTAPTVAFSAPNIPGGVNVAGTVLYKALSFATTANGTGYAVGDVLEVYTGTQTTKARAPVASIVTVGIPTVADGGDLYDLRGTQNDRIRFEHANLTTPLIVQVESVDESSVLTISVVQAGVWNGAGAPTSMANGVGGFTATTIAGFPTGDANGNGLVLTFPANIWGVYAFGTVSVAGSYTAFPSTGTDGTLTSVSPATGTGAKADITMGLLGITVSQRGSGYTTPADAAVTFSGSTGAAATAVLTTDSGPIGSATNQENAILVTAFIPVANGGTAAVIGDIIKQNNDKRYKVKTAEGTGICRLKTTAAANAAGEMTIKATDSAGGNYLVAKLTARKVVLVPAALGGSAGTQFASGASAKWTFGAAVENTTVTIENA
jgi:hypothetical protein